MSGRHTSGNRSSTGSRGRVGLAMRQVLADPWVSTALAVLVLLVTCIVTLWPRAVLDINTRQVAHEVSRLSAARSDVIGQTGGVADTAGFRIGTPAPERTVQATWGRFAAELERVRTSQPEPLRSLLRPAQFHVDVGPEQRLQIDPEAPIAQIDLQLRIDPDLTEHVRLVEGDWPRTYVPLPPGYVPPEGPPPGEQARQPQEVVITEAAAVLLSWEVGAVRTIDVQRGTAEVRLSGTYKPTDPQDPRWQQSVNGAEMGELYNPNLGRIAQLVGYLAPATPGFGVSATDSTTLFWYQVDGAALRGDEVGTVTAQIRSLTSGYVVVQQAASGEDEAGGPPLQERRVRLVTEVTDTFTTLAEQQRATSAILAVVAAGPLGVTLAVFALGARLIVQRRRVPLALARARGGSQRQLRGLLALEGLALGVPAAAIGYAVAGLVAPGSTGWGEWVLAGALALLPAGALLTGPAAPSLHEERHDLGTTPRRWRWIVELAVVALAALAVWRLLDRGLTGVGGADTGVDLLLAATPVLLALAACVVTLRLYPLPMHAVVRRLRGRASLTPFVGAARAVRDPAGGLIPALAVILGVGVATFSTVLATTITDGAERGAWAANGAQVRITGPAATPEIMQAVTGTDGVTSAAAVSESTERVDVSGALTGQNYTVYVVDDTLAQVHAAAPLVDSFPAELYADSSPLPVLVGGAEPPEVVTGDVELSGVGPARVVGHTEEIPGVRTDRSFLVVTRSAWERVGGTAPAGTSLLVATTATAPSAQDPVVQALASAVPSSLIEAPRAQLTQVQEAPVTSGLTAIFVAAVVLTLVLTVVTILLVQLMGTPSRVRLLAVLRTLGAAPRQARALTAWELGPLVGAALLVGAVLGAGVPWLLLRAVDLRGLTGGTVQPALSFDPVVLGLVALGVLGTVVLAIAVSAALAGRTDLAQQLRVGEER